MNIIQFWIVDTIVKVSPKNQQPDIISRDQSQSTIQQEDDERSPLLPK